MFELLALGSLVEKQQGGGTPPRNDPAFWHGDIPWASVKDFKDDQLELQATEETITSLGLRLSTSNLIPPGTPMVCTRMAVGRCAVSALPTAINQDVRALYPKKGINPRYLLRLVASLQVKAESLSVGSTVKGIRSPDFLAIKAHVAPENEQGVIASILDTLDTQIQKTEALIAKLEKVKAGLLHDLLTRGIDENGRLRPSPEEAPELYKESPLGLIPREWEISSAGVEFEITSGVTLGAHRRPKKHPTPYLRVANVHRDRLMLDEITMLEMTPVELEEKSLIVGDLLIVEGHANPNEIGRCAKVTEKAAGLTFQNHLFRLRASGILAGFSSLWMNSNLVRGYWRATCSTSSGLYTINRTQLGSVPVAKPSKFEQDLIVSEHEKLQLRLKTETGQLAKMWLQKQGLMDDLLTGRVRVTPLLDQAQATTPA